jgi:hypothetical protein
VSAAAQAATAAWVDKWRAALADYQAEVSGDFRHAVESRDAAAVGREAATLAERSRALGDAIIAAGLPPNERAVEATALLQAVGADNAALVSVAIACSQAGSDYQPCEAALRDWDGTAQALAQALRPFVR